jgi:tRNA (mo5U34)-methyltransferase
VSVYDLSPERLGTFDVVVMGSLTLHLEEPLRALEAVRSVCRGHFMSIEQINLELTLLHPRRPVAELNGSGPLLQWWVPNAAGHRRMVFAAGFEIERDGGRSVQPYGVAHQHRRGWGTLRRGLLERTMAGGSGVPVSAVLARPRVSV